MRWNHFGQREYPLSRLRVHKSTYEFFENQLLHTITAGSPPPDVAEAARALIQNCFTRRSASEWLIDHLPGPLLSATENLMTRRALAESASASSPVEVLTAISTPLPALVSSEAVAAPSEAVH